MIFSFHTLSQTVLFCTEGHILSMIIKIIIFYTYIINTVLYVYPNLYNLQSLDAHLRWQLSLTLSRFTKTMSTYLYTALASNAIQRVLHRHKPSLRLPTQYMHFINHSRISFTFSSEFSIVFIKHILQCRPTAGIVYLLQLSIYPLLK